MEASPGSARLAPGGLPFLIFGRVIPGAVFVFLGTIQVQALTPEVAAALHSLSDLGAIALIINRILFLVFVSAVALIYIMRKPPTLGHHGPFTFVVSMYASFILLALRPLSDLVHAPALYLWPSVAVLLSDALVIVGFGFAAYSLAYLRLNFSILPEARRVVTGGPYRIVRHPIYLGELLAAVGLVLVLFNWFSVAVLLSVVASQLYRTTVEERVLVAAVPGYADYRRQTRYRLIPGVI